MRNPIEHDRMIDNDEFGLLPEGNGPEANEPLADARAASRRPSPTPSQRALGLLVRREHSRKELARKLVARGIEPEAARAAVEHMSGEGWQSDARFAGYLVRSRVSGGYGPLHIRAELASHGLDPQLIADALAQQDEGWEEVARDMIRRRFGESGPGDAKQQRKAIELLMRRGFPGECIRRVLGGEVD